MPISAEARIRLRITRGDDIAVGPGKVDLLVAIDKNGSIAGAARELGMSSRRAGLRVDTMNRCFRSPVVDAESGGRRGGGAALSPLGAEVVRRYRRIESKAAKAGAADIKAFLALLAR